MGIRNILVERVKRMVLPIPVEAHNSSYSAIFSASDDASAPSERLLEIALAASGKARSVSMRDVSARMKRPPYYPDVWPGEHYKLLAGLVQVLEPELVVEIGTATGLSALALKKFLPKNGRIATFDVKGWKSFPGTCLIDEDFADGRLAQYEADLCDPAAVSEHAGLLGAADLIFIDAAKDGVMEQRFLDNFPAAGLKAGALLVFDDIRLWNMLKIWREIRMPKLDLTSFGHWSGTGLVEWVPGWNKIGNL